MKNKTNEILFNAIGLVCIIGLVFMGVAAFVLAYTAITAPTKTVQEIVIKEQPIIPKAPPVAEVLVIESPIVEEPKFIGIDCTLDLETQEYLYNLCEENGLDFTLMMAVIQKESTFKADVISAGGDYGLMQINRCNHAWLTKEIGVTDFLDAKQNITAGVYMFRKLFDKYEDTNKVLMAYNMGEGGARKLWSSGIYSTGYVETVLKYQSEMRWLCES